ncbi:hypothetical protein J6590_057542 [Homalodisca vitripennis]|nr:hypothetical protein J6590_057542 [Homalodisca vitripennis]
MPMSRGISNWYIFQTSDHVVDHSTFPKSDHGWKNINWKFPWPSVRASVSPPNSGEKSSLELVPKFRLIYLLAIMLQVSEHDMLPTMICQHCTFKLDMMYEFREASRKSELVLKRYLANSSSDALVSLQEYLNCMEVLSNPPLKSGSAGTSSRADRDQEMKPEHYIKTEKRSEEAMEEDEEERSAEMLNGYSDSDSDDEGQLRIAEEENYMPSEAQTKSVRAVN